MKEKESSPTVVNAPTAPSSPPTARGANRHVLGRALHLFTAPAKLLSTHAGRHYHRRYHGRYRFARQIFIVDIIVIGLIFSLAAFISAEFLARPKYPETIRVGMAITPGLPRSGDRVTLFFSYENRSRTVQEEVEVNLRLPRGFIPDQKDLLHYQPETRTFSAGNLSPGAQGSFEISGVLLAVPEASFEAATVTSARDARSGADWIRAVSFSFPIGPSALATELTVPQTLVAGEQIEATLSYRNQGNTVIDEAVIVSLLPEGLEIVGSEPELTAGSWRVLKIAPGSFGKLIVRTRLPSADTRASAEIGVRLGLRAEDQLIPQGQILRTIPVLSPRVSVESSTDEEAVGPGETLTIRISARNNGESVFHNVTLRLIFDPAWMNLDAARGARRDGASLLVSSGQAPGLENFRPGDSVVAEVSLPLNSGITPGADAVRPFVIRQSLTLEGEVEGYGRIAVSADPVEYPVSSALRLAAAARYFTAEGEQIGRGPLPPEVGKETRYWIFLDAGSAPNGARDVVVEGRLGSGVSWVNLESVSAPGAKPIVYDSATKIVRWELPLLDGADAGVSYGSAFAVMFLPTAEEVGSPAVLFDSVTIRGVDDSTGREISASAPDVTTELADDQTDGQKM